MVLGVRVRIWIGTEVRLGLGLQRNAFVSFEVMGGFEKQGKKKKIRI